MRKSTFAIFSLLVLVLSVMAANAAILRVGDSSTLASLREEGDNVYRTITWTIPRVNETSNMVCEVTPISGKYINTNDNVDGNINVTFTTSGIASGQSFSVASGTSGLVVKSRIPETLDAVDPATLAEGSFKVADIVCSIPGTNYSTAAELFMQRKNMYDFKKISATHDDKSDSIKDLSGEEIKDLRPGEVLDLEVEAENLYDSDFNMDITATLFLDTDSSFFDCDSDDEDLDIDAGDKDTVTFSCDVDEEAEKADTDLTLRLVAVDDFGATMGANVEFTAQIEREKYDFRILSFTVNPQATICGDESSRTITATVKTRNDGDKDEKDGKIEVVSPQLGISQSAADLEMDSTDELSKRFTFSIPSTVKAGTYDIFAKTYNLGTSQSDSAMVRFTVPDCNVAAPIVPVTPAPVTPVTPAPVTPVTPAPVTPKQDVVIITPPTVVQNATADADDEADNGTGLSSNSVYLVLLVILIVVLIAGIIGLVIYLLRPAN